VATRRSTRSTTEDEHNEHAPAVLEAVTRWARGQAGKGRLTFERVDDVVQETLVRWYAQPLDGRDPVAVAIEIAKRVAKESARHGKNERTDLETAARLAREMAKKRGPTKDELPWADRPAKPPPGYRRTTHGLDPATEPPPVPYAELGPDGAEAVMALLGRLPIGVTARRAEDGGGYAINVNPKERVPASLRRALLAAARSLVGHDPAVEPWAQAGRQVYAIAEAVHREANGSRVDAEDILRRAGECGVNLLPESAARLADAGLGRGGGRGQRDRRGLEAEVRAIVNAARKRAGLGPLPARVWLRPPRDNG